MFILLTSSYFESTFKKFSFQSGNIPNDLFQLKNDDASNLGTILLRYDVVIVSFEIIPLSKQNCNILLIFVEN